jgi:hypothetical protein
MIIISYFKRVTLTKVSFTFRPHLPFEAASGNMYFRYETECAQGQSGRGEGRPQVATVTPVACLEQLRCGAWLALSLSVRL